jgi:hypothetical protein
MATTSTIGGLICGLRNVLDQGFRSLPTILGGASLFLGMTQGNVNWLFFFVGMYLLVPLAVALVNGGFELLVTLLPTFLVPPSSMWKVAQGSAEACGLLSTGKTPAGIPADLIVVPTFWMSMIAFFFTYIFSNALKLYRQEPANGSSSAKVSARKNQALLSMITVAALAAVFTVVRYGTSCETGLGITVAWLLGGGLGYGWYSFMRSCGLGRLDDIFGISNRLLPMQSTEDNDPTVCVPVK